MSTHPTQTDLGALEALLAEHAAKAERDALRALLAPAARPAAPRELRGEAVALAAFRAHCPPVVVPARSRAALPSRLARAMSIKAAVAAFTVVGMGGVAVAASTGSLPGPIDLPGSKPANVQPGEHASERGAQQRSDAADAALAAVAQADRERLAARGAELWSRKTERQIAAYGRMCRYEGTGEPAQRLISATGSVAAVPEFCRTVAAAAALSAEDRAAAKEARRTEVRDTVTAPAPSERTQRLAAREQRQQERAAERQELKERQAERESARSAAKANR